MKTFEQFTNEGISNRSQHYELNPQYWNIDAIEKYLDSKGVYYEKSEHGKLRTDIDVSNNKDANILYNALYNSDKFKIK